MCGSISFSQRKSLLSKKTLDIVHVNCEELQYTNNGNIQPCKVHPTCIIVYEFALAENACTKQLILKMKANFEESFNN